MRLALHRPDQAGNVGAVLRLAACLGVPVDTVEPRGFPFFDRQAATTVLRLGPNALFCAAEEERKASP